MKGLSALGKTLIFLSVIQACGGCLKTDFDVSPATEEEKTIEVGLRLRSRSGMNDAQTRSAMFGGDDIDNLHIFVWRDGTCVQHKFLETVSGDIRLSLICGGTYSFYAVANCGDKLGLGSESWRMDESSMARMTVRLPGDNEEKHGLPMAGCVRNFIVRSSGTQPVIDLEHLVSRISLAFAPDKALETSGIRVTGVRLRDAATSMTPFTGGYRAAETNVADGDFSSEEDLQILNSGGEVSFYAFENCWGDLLPDNTDQKKKVPEEFGNIKGPTYIEVSCTFGGDGLLTGSLTYKIYLGSDTTGNFDLERNSVYRITISGTKTGLREISWRIDRKWRFNNYLATLEITKGRHSQENLYVGEVFLGRITDIDPSLIAYFGNDVDEMLRNCRIECIDPYGYESPIDIEITGTDEDGSILLRGTCVTRGFGELWIWDSDGYMVSVIDDGIYVNPPVIVYSLAENAEYPEDPGDYLDAIINGDDGVINVYFCDSDGMNLLVEDEDFVDYVSDVFDLKVEDNAKDWYGAYAYEGGLKTYLSDIYDHDETFTNGQPYCKLGLHVTNSGWTLEGCSDFCDMIGHYGAIRAGVSDKEQGIGENVYGFNIGYIPLHIDFYDKLFLGKEIASKYGIKEKHFMVVTNPSNMPFCFNYLALARVNGRETAALMEVPENTAIYFYNCPAGIYLPSSMYMIWAETNVHAYELISTTHSTWYMAEDGTTIIGIRDYIEDLMHVTEKAETQYSSDHYGYTVNNYPAYYGLNLSNVTGMVDFTDGNNNSALDYSFADSLYIDRTSTASGYTYIHDYGYGSTVLYSNNYPEDAGDHLFRDYPYVTPRNIADIMKKRACKVQLSMNTGDGEDPYIGMKVSKNIKNVQIRSNFHCEGYCKTYPNGTWGKSVENYPTAEHSSSADKTEFELYGVHNISGTGVRTALDKIYNTTFFDSYNKIGSANNYQKHSQPTKLTMDLEFDTSNSGNEWYMFKFTNCSTINIQYSNGGEGPYDVKTVMDWKTTHGRFTHKLITLD